MTFTTHFHLAPRLQKAKSYTYTSTLPSGSSRPVKKGKVRSRRGRDDPGKEFVYSYTRSLTSALFEGLGGQFPAPTALSPRKVTQYPLYRRLAGPKGQSEQVQKTSPPPLSDPGTVQPLASRYTDYSIPAHSRPVQW
jgi:hypothetical protein